MHAALMPRKPAPVLARGAMWLRLGVRPNALGNVIGDSLAAASSSGSTYVSQEERLRDQFWEQALGPVESRSTIEGSLVVTRRQQADLGCCRFR
ncbi:hypothetical protein [Xenophilus sp.]|uniref:hypothetical protein n=1 Tax=Xenophilus sp. TaxID=1873499 RepID=UPI0037DD9E2C